MMYLDDDYRRASFAAACLDAGEKARGGWTAYVLRREEIPGGEEYAAITAGQWRAVKRFGWERVLSMTSQFVDPAEAA